MQPELRDAAQKWLAQHGPLLIGTAGLELDSSEAIARLGRQVLQGLGNRCTEAREGRDAMAADRIERAMQGLREVLLLTAAGADEKNLRPRVPNLPPELRDAVQRWLGAHGGLLAGMPPLRAETVGSIWRSANALLNSLTTRYTALRENGQFEDAARVERALQELRDIRWTASALGGSEGAA